MTHFKPPGKRTIELEAEQLACKQDENLVNAVCEEEKELPQRVANKQYS